jgi:hypothetical protein
MCGATNVGFSIPPVECDFQLIWLEGLLSILTLILNFCSLRASYFSRLALQSVEQLLLWMLLLLEEQLPVLEGQASSLGRFLKHYPPSDD